MHIVGAVEQDKMDKKYNMAQQVQEQFMKATSSGQSEGEWLAGDSKHATLKQ